MRGNQHWVSQELYCNIFLGPRVTKVRGLESKAGCSAWPLGRSCQRLSPLPHCKTGLSLMFVWVQWWPGISSAGIHVAFASSEASAQPHPAALVTAEAHLYSLPVASSHQSQVLQRKDKCKRNKMNLPELFSREWCPWILWGDKWRSVIRCLQSFSNHFIFVLWMLLVNQLQVFEACGPETVESEIKLCLFDSDWSVFKRLSYCSWNLSGFVPLTKCVHSRWWHQPPLSECRYLYYAKGFLTLLYSDDDWKYRSC